MHKYNKKVLYPHFYDVMCEIGGNRYSLLLDESNGISVLKMFRDLVIYYGNNCGKVASTYLDLIQIEKCDAESIVSAHMVFLAHNKFDIKNLVRIGNDNASAMVEINNGVYTNLRNDVSSIILI